MPQLVSNKRWVRFTDDELIAFIKEQVDTISSNKFIITDVNIHKSEVGPSIGHRIDHVTFELSLPKEE